MNKVAFIIIGILVIATIFVVILSRTNSKNPLSALGDTTPTPVNVNNDTIKPEQNSKTITPMPTFSPDKIISATQASIITPKGEIDIELYPKDAPKTVENFATLAKNGYYNGLTFHRVVSGFVIQGGDPNGDGSGGTSIFGPTFEDELNPNTPSYKAGYLEGVVAMANRGPNTNGSQFFIMLADNTSLPHAYTIFGKVTKGMDVVKQIQVGDKMTSVTVK